LRKLYQLCQEHTLRLSSSDVVRFVCRQCNEQEVCPAMLTDEYDSKFPASAGQVEQLDVGQAEDAKRDVTGRQ
jgi:hypothetical protein